MSERHEWVDLDGNTSWSEEGEVFLDWYFYNGEASGASEILRLARELREANEAIRGLNEIVEYVQRTTSEHLPPDGITEHEALTRIIAATDCGAQRYVQGLPAVARALAQKETK